MLEKFSYFRTLLLIVLVSISSVIFPTFVDTFYMPLNAWAASIFTLHNFSDPEIVTAQAIKEILLVIDVIW